MELADLLRRRRMVRSFDPAPLTPDERDAVVAAGLRAPTAGNCQGIDLVVLEGRDQTARYWDTTLPPPRRSAFRWQALLTAPALVVVVADPDGYLQRYAEPDKVATGLGRGTEAWDVPYWHVDAGMAIMAMLLRAQDLGLGALFFGVFAHADALARRLGIPVGRAVVGTVAVGHPAPEDPHGPGRSANRPRRIDRVHRGGW